jgi:peptide/nickel transport system substrate-binding protein
MAQSRGPLGYVAIALLGLIFIILVLFMWQQQRLYERFNDVDRRLGEVETATNRSSRRISKLIESGGIRVGPDTRPTEMTSFDHKRYTWQWPEDYDGGGQMIIRWSAEPKTLNVITHKDVYGSLIASYCYDSLIVRHIDTTEFVPELAYHWTTEQDSTLYFADDASARAAEEALASRTSDLEKLAVQRVRRTGAELVLHLGAAGAGFEADLLKLLPPDARPLPVVYVPFSIHLDRRFPDGAPVTVESLLTRAITALKDHGKSVTRRVLWESDYSPHICVVTGDGEALHKQVSELLQVDRKSEDERLGSTESPVSFLGVHRPVFTFYLRRGVDWTDGKPVTAHDAVFGFETTVNPKIDAARAANYYADVQECRALDDYTIQFIWKRPYFLALGFSGGVSILPKHVYDFGMDTRTKEWADKFNDWRGSGRDGDLPLVGNGMYKVDKWVENDRVILTRNEDYWGTKPGLKKLIIRFIKDETVAITELKNGNLDYMSLTPEQWEREATQAWFKKDFQKFKYLPPQSGYVYIAWNNRAPIFKDRRVRQAMTYAMNRQKFIETLERNLAIVRSGPFFPYGKQSAPDIEPREFDLAKARTLLAEAGWKPGPDGVLVKDGTRFEFGLKIPSGARSYERMCEAMRQDLEPLGVKMKTEPLEWRVFVTFLDTREYQAISLGWTGSLEGDPYQIWHSSQAAGTGSNHVGFINARADQLIEMARTELDEKKRNAYYHEFHRILYEEQPYTFFRTRYSLLAVHTRIKGIKIHTLGLPIGAQKEWYVPEALQVGG